MGVMFETDLEWMAAGLDLAASGRDFSTLVLAELYDVPIPGQFQHHVFTGAVSQDTETHYVVRGIHRWPRGTAPGDVVDDAAVLLDEPALAYCQLRYDATGMGAGVSTKVRDLQRAGRFPGGVRGMTIVGGEQSRTAGTVPKVDLVTTLSRLLHERRLHVLECELAKAWQTEMNAFQAKVTQAGNVRYEAQTETVHDDLVMGTALAVTARRRGRPVALQWLYQEVLGEPIPQPRLRQTVE